jgi:hypothetical protein
MMALGDGVIGALAAGVLAGAHFAIWRPQIGERRATPVVVLRSRWQPSTAPSG